MRYGIMPATKCPYDLLPIPRPLEDDTELPSTYFYDNVIVPLIPDILKLETTGIPINLDKVIEVEKAVDNVLENVRQVLSSNSVMERFLHSQNEKQRSAKMQELQTKKKDASSFLKPFDIRNKIHRSYVVNYFLEAVGKPDMCMDEWSIKDLKKLNQITAYVFLQNLIDNKIEPYMEPYINGAMDKLAQDKADFYNKNKIEKKSEEISDKQYVEIFNPASSKQKQDFFSFYGIESESETKAGAAKWDRKELQRLKQLLDIMIEDKEGEHDVEDA